MKLVILWYLLIMMLTLQGLMVTLRQKYEEMVAVATSDEPGGGYREVSPWQHLRRGDKTHLLKTVYLQRRDVYNVDTLACHPVHSHHCYCLVVHYHCHW